MVLQESEEVNQTVDRAKTNISIDYMMDPESNIMNISRDT